MKAEDYLAAFKETTRIEGLDIVVADWMTRRILIAWQQLPIRWRFPEGEQPAPEAREAPSWLWRHAEIDFEALAKLAGVEYAVVVDRWPLLKGQRILYPDGTIYRQAEVVIRNAIAKNIGIQPGGKDDKASPGTPAEGSGQHPPLPPGKDASKRDR